ncbi:MAG: type II secretion system F family protein [Aggregatilineales bacterium]
MNFDEARQLIHDVNPRTREQAARALGLFYDADVVATLLIILQDESEARVKIAIVQALGKVNAREAISPLEAMLSAGMLNNNLADVVQTELARLKADQSNDDRPPKKPLPDTELFDPEKPVPVTDDLNNPRITERPTEPLSKPDWLEDDSDTDTSTEPIRFDDNADPFDWLRQLPGKYLVDDSPDDAEATYDWMQSISPDDLQNVQHKQHNSSPKDEQAHDSAGESTDESEENTPTVNDPFGAYINTLDENTIHHENDAMADWLDDYVAEIDDRDEEQGNGVFNSAMPDNATDESDLPSPEDAETIEELDDIWTEAINNAVEKMMLITDSDPDLVELEDDGGWLNNFDDDELFLYPQKFSEFKRGDVVFLPDVELEFRFDGRFFLLKTQEDSVESIESIAAAVFQPLYLELVDTPETLSFDDTATVALPADSIWQRGGAWLRDRLLLWRDLILLAIGLISVTVAGISLIGTSVSVVSLGLLVFGVLSLISAIVLIRRDWLGATALEVRLEQISQTETFLPRPQTNGDMIAGRGNSRRLLSNMDSFLDNRWFSRRWKRQLHLVQLAGQELSLTQFATLHLLSALSLYVFILVLSGGQQVTAILLGVVGLSLPQLYTAFAISNRVTRFKTQLPDTLGLWVNALRTGYSGLQALESIARDAPEPTATEFKRTVQELLVGVQIEEAYNHLLERVDDEDLDFVLTAVNIQHEVGGNLAEILDIIGYTIRERIKLAGETATQVKARYRTFFVIAALLPLLQTVIFTPYFEQALTTITGQLALLMGYTLIAITLTFSANINHVLRRTSVSADNFWVLRRDNLFDLGIGMALISLIFALGTSPLLVLWLGLMLFVIISDHAILGLSLSIPVVATAVFTDGDLSTLPAKFSDAINLSSQTVLIIVGAGLTVSIIGAVLWRAWQSRRNNVQSLVDVRLVALCLQPINVVLRVLFYLAPAKGLVESLIGKISTSSPSSNEDASYIDESTVRFYARCMLWALVLSVLAVWLGINANASPLTIAAYGLTGAVIGYFIPPLRRYNQIKRKQEQIRMALPDALDLLVICMEAGLGFDSAMGKVYDKWDNELAFAFGRVLREIQLGKLRRVAMRDMGQRLNVSEVDSFVAAIIQSDQLGVSLARTMRLQSDQIRTAWKRRFENKVSTNNQIMDQLSLFLFVPGINLWLIAPIIARMFAG